MACPPGHATIDELILRLKGKTVVPPDGLTGGAVTSADLITIR